MTTRSSDLRYDPYDAALDADPHPVWRRLRDESPLYHNEEHGFFALSRFDDVLAASTDWRTYSSAAPCSSSSTPRRVRTRSPWTTSTRRST